MPKWPLKMPLGVSSLISSFLRAMQNFVYFNQNKEGHIQQVNDPSGMDFVGHCLVPVCFNLANTPSGETHGLNTVVELHKYFLVGRLNYEMDDVKQKKILFEILLIIKTH